MPTQTDRASDYDIAFNLLYERSLIRLRDGKRQMIRARRGKRVRHHGFETLGRSESLNGLIIGLRCLKPSTCQKGKA